MAAPPPPGPSATPDPASPELGFIDRWRERAERIMVQGLGRLEDERAKRRSVRIAFEFYERDRAFAGNLLAGGLAFRLFLWFLPFSLSMIILLGALADGLDRPPSEIAEDAGLSLALAAMVDDAVADSAQARIYLGAIGVVLVLWTGYGVAKALRLVSRLAWGLTSVRSASPLKASLWVAGFFAGILAVQWAVNRLQAGPLGVDVLVYVLAGLALAALITWLLNALPRPDDVPWTAMLPGAVLLTVGLAVLRVVTIVYFSRRLESADDLYGGLGLAAVFLAWLYLIGRILVTSIALNATLWRGTEPDSLTG